MQLTRMDQRPIQVIAFQTVADTIEMIGQPMITLDRDQRLTPVTAFLTAADFNIPIISNLFFARALVIFSKNPRHVNPCTCFVAHVTVFPACLGPLELLLLIV